MSEPLYAPDVRCRHFGTCGGCALQHLEPDNYLGHKRALILDALARHGIVEPPLRDIVRVPPYSRRRATLKLQKLSGKPRIGFHAPRSHQLIDIEECQVLRRRLFNVARGTARMLSPLLRGNETIDLYLTDAENGADLAIDWKRPAAPELSVMVSAAAPRIGLVRVTAGADLLFQNAAPEVRFGQATVQLPPKAFLQPTKEGERALQEWVANGIGKSKSVIDLFSGCGTFTLPLAEKAGVHAVDADGPMIAALAQGVRGTAGLKPVTTERRDLFTLPLSARELNAFEGAVLDPPRAGALAQTQQLAQSRLRRIAYVSCDAASFARDARVLIDAGFRMDWLVGVDQFLWSAHIELAAAFSRK